MRERENPGMNMAEMETLLETPREHPDFTMWFLKERGWVVRTDNGRYSITIAGVEEAEKMEVWGPRQPEHLLLEPAY